MSGKNLVLDLGVQMGPFGPILIKKIFIEILNVLSNLKKKNLFHMDIKPCNILMSERLI